MNRDWLQEALAYFNTDIPQWYGWKKDWTGEKRMSYENLILNNDSATMPTEAQVDAKIEELKQEEIDREARKASAKTKLEALGLTTEEIKEAFGL